MPMVGRHLLVFDPEMSTTSLPTEIYPKFFENLDHFDDGNTLLSIAQCSRLFCIESLRVFFSIAFLEYWGRSKPPSSVILTRHEALLEAILRAPNHLGPLVRSYNQYNISCHANAAARVSTDKTTPDAGSWPGQQIHVFNLTAQALHHMPNLKEFRFMPAGTHECSELLSRVPRYVYPFQLKTLDWRYGDTAYEKDFLSTQSSLRCLDVFSWRFRADDVLRNCISPVLESMSGSLGELCVVAAGRDIVALEYIEWADGDDEFLMQLPGAMQPSDAIARIKYLRLHGGGNLETYLTLASKAGHASQEYHIMLLVIGELERENVSQYYQLPSSLEVLVLQNWRNTNSDLDEESRRNIACTVFPLLPKLRYIFICFNLRGVTVYAWRMSKNSAIKDALGDIGILEEVVSFRDASGDDWWRGHLDVLENHTRMSRTFIEIRSHLYSTLCAEFKGYYQPTLQETMCRKLYKNEGLKLKREYSLMQTVCPSCFQFIVDSITFAKHASLEKKITHVIV